MRIHPAAGFWSVVPVGVTLTVLAIWTSGFKSPDDVVGDRDRHLADAQAAYEQAVFRAHVEYMEKAPIADRWDVHAWGIPASGWAFIGSFAAIVLAVLLTWLASDIQRVRHAKATARSLREQREHEERLEAIRLAHTYIPPKLSKEPDNG